MLQLDLLADKFFTWKKPNSNTVGFKVQTFTLKILNTAWFPVRIQWSRYILWLWIAWDNCIYIYMLYIFAWNIDSISTLQSNMATKIYFIAKKNQLFWTGKLVKSNSLEVTVTSPFTIHKHHKIQPFENSKCRIWQ